MRFFFISFPQPVFPEIVDVATALKARGHNIVYWLGLSEPPFSIDELGTSQKIGEQFLSGMDDEHYPPIDASDILSIAPFESSIMDFLHRTYPRYAHPELERQYYSLLRYCKGIFYQLKPDVVVFRTTPNLPPLHFIFFAFAKAHGVKTLIFCDTWVCGRVVLMKDYMTGVAGLSLTTTNVTPHTLSDLPQDLRVYYQSHLGDTSMSTPLYMPHILDSYTAMGRLKAGWRAIIRALRAGMLTKILPTLFRFGSRWIRSHLGQELPRAYARLQSPPDFSAKYVYFPLHLQPEFSTNPLGGQLKDQLLVLELLAASLPSGWKIYIKEHPTEWPVAGTRFHPYRFSSYYRTMARFSCVQFVPITTDTFELIRHAQAVATVSGTAGFEALLRGKPALIFGFPWYMFAPGVFRVDSVATCRAAFAKIIVGYTPHSASIIQFLKQLDDVSFRGCLDLHYRTNPKFFTMTPQEQGKNILDAILRSIS